MTQLETLIQTLCPNGVKFVPLWSVTAWDKHFKGIDKSMQQKIVSYPYLLAADLFALDTGEGDVFLLSTGAKTGWTTEEKAGEYLREGEVVAIPWGGTPNVKYHKGKFVTADNRIATSLDTNVLSNKFLYYWMNNNIDLIASFYRGAGIQHPSMYDILSLQIPLPPLAVQSEIVRILDKFTLYKSELAAELAARLQQYEYYRDNLFVLFKDAPLYRIGDIIDSLKTGLNPRQSFKLNIKGANCFYITGKNINNNLINTDVKTDLITEETVNLINKRANLCDNILLFASTGTGTVGRMAYVDNYDHTWAVSETLYCIKVNKEILNTKYLMFALYSNQAKKQFVPKISKGSVPHLKVADLLDVKIPLPPLSEQERIVSILDRFDKLCNDIREGLPAEIDLRQKQYEHYRDKLLTFEAKG